MLRRPVLRGHMCEVGLRVGVYCRLSKDDTGHQTATERQARACRSFAEVRGWDVSGVYEDVDLSAYRPNVTRPGYEALLRALEAGQLDGVLVWKLDRLVRRSAQFERFCESAWDPRRLHTLEVRMEHGKFKCGPDAEAVSA